MKKIVFLALLFSVNAFAQDGYNQIKDLDVLHYDFDLTLSDTSDLIKGKALITFQIKSSMDQISLDLIEKRATGGMQVSAVLIDGTTTSFSHENGKINIKLPQIEPGKYTATVIYEGVPLDGLIIDTNKFGDRTFFGDNWPNRARNWLPCVDHPSDKASVDFTIKAPSQYMVIANGYKTEESYLDSHTKITRWHQEVPIAMKVAVIGAARFATTLYGEYDGIPVSAWVYPQNRNEGFSDYQYALEILEYFDQAIGEYPFVKLANVQSKTRYGGMENASNIFYFENSVTGNKDHEPLIAHEIAHQWFGNSATEITWHHLWLSEGFATYFTHLYMENKYGSDTLQHRMAQDRQKVINFSKTRFTPVIDSTEYDYMKLLNAHSYQKGSWVLHMLRNELGDEIFWGVIQSYYEQFRDANAATSDFQTVAEQISGLPLNYFFDQWLRQPGHPVMKIRWKYHSSKKKLIVQVEQLQKENFNVKLDIALMNKEKLTVQSIKIDQKKQKIEITCDKKPDEVIFDPHTNLLFELK